jgi:uncharacterized protein with GYD domain
MHFVLLASHTPESCPTSNAKTKELLLEVAPRVQGIAETAGVKIVAGPYVNREHMIVTVVDAGDSESVDRFLVESRLSHWNSVRVLPSLSMEDGMAEIRNQPAIF